METPMGTLMETPMDTPMDTPTGTPMSWPVAELQSALGALLPGLQVQVLAEGDSTNTRLLEQARSDTTPRLLAATAQTAGRGRMGRAWLAQPGASLCFSMGLPLAPRRWEGLSLAAGLALADALEPINSITQPAIGLKWPNDLWLWEGAGRGRKLGGVLIETTGNMQQRYCVVGVGLNIAAPEPTGDALLSMPRACLQELQPGLTAPAALARVAAPLLQALLRFEAEGFAALVQSYARRDLLRGQAVYTFGQAELRGHAEGVDADGALCLRDLQSRHVHRIVSGEVSVRFSDTQIPALSPASC